MNWNEILTQIILILIGALGSFVTYLINKWVKNNELKEIISSLNEVVRNAVLETYQTYVEELKEKNIFDLDAQKRALEKSLNTIKVNLPQKVKKWLEANFEDVEAYLKSLIEAQIGALKNSGR